MGKDKLPAWWLRGLGRDNHVRLFRSFDAGAHPEAEVPDPYFGGSDGFDTVLRMAERAADEVRTRITRAVASAIHAVDFTDVLGPQ